MASSPYITNNQQRCLRAQNAPLKAFSVSALSLQTRRATPTKRCALRDVTNEQDAPRSIKRRRVALGTQGLGLRQTYPQVATTQRLAAVCSVPLPPLYGRTNFPVHRDVVETRSMETQTSATPYKYNSKFAPWHCLTV